MIDYLRKMWSIAESIFTALTSRMQHVSERYGLVMLYNLATLIVRTWECMSLVNTIGLLAILNLSIRK